MNRREFLAAAAAAALASNASAAVPVPRCRHDPEIEEEEDKLPVPDIRVWNRDVTDLYPEDYRERAGTIAEVYVFDANLHVHVCSLMPSYEIHFIGSTWTKWSESDEENDRLAEEIADGDRGTPLVDYVDVRGFDLSKLEKLRFSKGWTWEDCLDDADGDRTKARQLLIDQAIEYCQGNGYIN